MTENCRCIYGIGPEFNGEFRVYDEKNHKEIDPMIDLRFDFCPICGRSLREEEER